jgi:myosin heavy chain 6/7
MNQSPNLHCADLEVERSLALEADEQVVALTKQKEEIELQLIDLEERLDDEQEVNTQLSATKRKLELQTEQLRQQLAEESVAVERLQVTTRTQLLFR